MKLYNSLTRKKEDFQPYDPSRVTMYVCGPTVYSYAHIGNARPVVVFDVLFRLLRLAYGEDHVIYARNFTDIDDKINVAATEQGVPISTITEKFIEIYRADMAALGALTPSLEPRVTQTMPQVIDMIERLVEAGHAYAAEGHVLFDVTSFDDYGSLARRDRDEMLAGARVEVAPYKKDPGDFVLWKPSSDDLPGWDSPWGRGRPGWHIECSAMAESYLGNKIDIHGGGIDLIFPHHENELAQSTCAHGGEKFAQIWMHNGFLNIQSEKMSKSIGNVLLVHELIEDFPGELIRLVLLSAHYRQPVDWTDDTIAQAKAALDSFYTALRKMAEIEAQDVDVPAAFLAALEDDLNTPQALAALHALVRDANKTDNKMELGRIKGQLLKAGAIIGLLQDDPETWFQGGGDVDHSEIEALIAERRDARKAKDFVRADQIRDQLTDMGIEIEDGASGTTWKRA